MSTAKIIIREVAAECGGYFRSKHAVRSGVNRAQIQHFMEEGFIEKVGRGLYRISDFPPHPFPDIASVVLQAPEAVICLISALSFHGITTQVPHQIDLSISKGRHIPKIDYPPIEVHQISEPAFSAGVEVHDLEGVAVRIYCIEKTLADCFKFRNNIGMDVTIEALKLYRERKKMNVKALVEYAKICRVMRVMEPYLESLYMTQKVLKDVAASVRQRLANLAKAERRPFQEVLQYYVMDRFLYRLSISEYNNTFILKGGLMLRVWGGPTSRPTMDIDLLGQTSNDVDSIVEIMTKVSRVLAEDDGMGYDADSAHGSVITKDGDYKGVRVTIPCSLAGAQMVVQVDIGFGDTVYPKPELRKLPTQLEQNAACLQCYPQTTLIAEKFEAMVHLGELNSRVKDFFDIWLLSKTCTFKGEELLESIRRTFSQRETLPDAELPFLEPEFAEKRAPNWKSFRKKMKRETIPDNFFEIVAELRAFLAPLNEALISAETLKKWTPDGGWQK